MLHSTTPSCRRLRCCDEAVLSGSLSNVVRRRQRHFTTHRPQHCSVQVVSPGQQVRHCSVVHRQPSAHSLSSSHTAPSLPGSTSPLFPVDESQANTGSRPTSNDNHKNRMVFS